MAASRWWILGGLALALAVAALSLFASPNPDGLERVARDQGFEDRAIDPPAGRLPFASVFEGYTLRGLEQPAVAKVFAGFAGTLLVFGGAWGIGAWVRRARKRVDS